MTMPEEQDKDVEEDDPKDDKQEGVIERRHFLNNSWKVLGVALVAEAAWTSYDLLKPGTAEGFGGVVDAGNVSEFAQEGTVKYLLNGQFYVTQYKGGLRALYQKCPHLGCRVPWDQSSNEFHCPCHGSIYNIIGEYQSGPAPRGMDRFPITIRNGEVFVDTSTPVEGPPPGTHEGPSVGPGAAR
jgi:cytochrome b6-f complex iron-sulfur subunit